MMIHDHGLRSLLASTEGASIEICDCGTIHLTIGALTLRLPQDLLASLARITDEASRRLGASTATAPKASRGMLA